MIYYSNLIFSFFFLWRTDETLCIFTYSGFMIILSFITLDKKKIEEKKKEEENTTRLPLVLCNCYTDVSVFAYGLMYIM